MNTCNINNSGTWCKKCKKPNEEVFIDIKTNESTEIYKMKIEKIMLLCNDCLNKDFVLEILNDNIREKKEIMKSLKKELFYHNEILKEFNKKLLSIEWENYQDFQE